MSEFRGYTSPLGGTAITAGNEPVKNVEPGTPGYGDLLATFKTLGIDRPETKEEMVTAVKNILSGKNRTYNEMMTPLKMGEQGSEHVAMPPGYAMQRQQKGIRDIAPPSVLYDFLHYLRDLPETIYHGFQDALGDRLQKPAEQVGREAYTSLDPQYRPWVHTR